MSAEKQANDKNLFLFAIYILIVAAGWMLPPLDPITPAGMRLLFLFIAAIAGWTFTTNNWLTLATLLILPFVGLTTSSMMLAAGFGSDTFVLTLYADICRKIHSGVCDFGFGDSWCY